MKHYDYGNKEAKYVLIQMIGKHSLKSMESEIAHLKTLMGASADTTKTPAGDEDFLLVACLAEDWNRDLTPWEAPPAFGNEPFGGKGQETLDYLLGTLIPEIEDMPAASGSARDFDRTYIIGGYSLAGLFALWAAHETDRFAGVAAASPSIWFPGFVNYMKEREVLAKSVYLSLGDKEAKSRLKASMSVKAGEAKGKAGVEKSMAGAESNPCATGDAIRAAHERLDAQGVATTLEWNPGNHFKEPDLRTAKAFAWALKKTRQAEG